MASSLSKVFLRGNPNYQASGIKSYVWLLRKYGFKPTRPGPYQHSEARNLLVKQLADGTTGEVYGPRLPATAHSNTDTFSVRPKTSRMIPPIQL